MSVFLEALFLYREDSHSEDHWQDNSTSEYFVFESHFGAVRLRKRTTYPYTFAYAYGSQLYLGYGDEETGRRVA
jgi:hypothetical protein